MFRNFFSRNISKRYRQNFNPKLGASQNGEDGIIAEVFKRIGVSNGWFVEFGAWDGVKHSNTYAAAQRGWQGVMIECDRQRYVELQRNMEQFPRVQCLRRMITLDIYDKLDTILQNTGCPKRFDLLSIDIDGNDYWIWKSLQDYKPNVVVIEYNSNFSPEEKVTIPYSPNHVWDGTMFYGASAAALIELANAKGYRLVAYTTGTNLFFVRNELANGKFPPVYLVDVPQVKQHAQSRRGEFVDTK